MKLNHNKISCIKLVHLLYLKLQASNRGHSISVPLRSGTDRRLQGCTNHMHPVAQANYFILWHLLFSA